MPIRCVISIEPSVEASNAKKRSKQPAPQLAQDAPGQVAWHKKAVGEVPNDPP